MRILRIRHADPIYTQIYVGESCALHTKNKTDPEPNVQHALDTSTHTVKHRVTHTHTHTYVFMEMCAAGRAANLKC